MPSPLKLFNTFTLPFAADDLAPPAVFGLLVRGLVVPLFVVLTALAAAAPTSPDCVSSALSPLSVLVWLLVVTTVNAVQWAFILRNALKGSIMDWDLRDGPVTRAVQLRFRFHARGVRILLTNLKVCCFSPTWCSWRQRFTARLSCRQMITAL